MVTDHANDIAEYQMALRVMSDERLKQFAQNTLPTIRNHYHMAQQLAGRLASATPNTPADAGTVQSASAAPGM